MAVIHILDKHTAELIAAGEVVERPASVVKELVENAIDAGAARIVVKIERGGIASIAVQDDGSGIESEYIATAFVRHATSKIEKEQDLDAIGTLGFRGEALASISAVAKVEVLTRTKVDEFACLYRQQGGEELSFEAAARPVGTTVTVRDLFFNVPARMKFLKKDQSEAGYVSDVVLRQALAHPEIAFSFYKDGKEQFATVGDGRLRSAVGTALAKDFSGGLLEVSAADGRLSIAGLVSAPTACRGSRGMQFFFVNGRYVQNATMTAALEAAYKGAMMQGRFPGCVLNVQMPYDRVDVNVHPAKTEVRFANANEIFDLVYRAVRGTVLSPAAPSRQFAFDEQKKMPGAPELSQQAAFMPTTVAERPVQNDVMQKSFTAVTPFPLAAKADFSARPEPSVLAGGEALRQTPSVPYFTRQNEPDLERMPNQSAPQTTAFPVNTSRADKTEMPASFTTKAPADDRSAPHQLSMAPQEEQTPSLRYVGEVFKTYLVAECENELILIDKHAAHERILYEKLVAGYGQTNGQTLLGAITVALTAEEKNALMDAADLLEKAGFEIEDFGAGSVVVRSVPAVAADGDIAALVEEVAHKLTLNTKDALSEKEDWVLHSVACRAAIKAGDNDRPEALMRLAQDIFSGKVPPFCPHGRPVILKLARKELEKQFGRLG